MNILLIGGTGLISTGIIKHLLQRGDKVTMFNRGQRPNRLAGPVECISGDRNDPARFSQCAREQNWDVVIDMICFTPAQAEASINTFRGKCGQFIFCSTVCTYGVKIPPHVVVDENFEQEPISTYGRNKLACEKLFMQAHERGDFATTIIRPSHTYGEGGGLIDQLEFNACSWDRIEKGLPVLLADGGMALWNSTHRDDCGKAFAFACLNDKTFGQAYNATTERVFTWRDYYREVGVALGRPVRVASMPASWIVAQDPKRFGLLAEISRFHGAYTSQKAQRDIPGFSVEVDFVTGARRTLDDLKARSAWRDGAADPLYQRMVDHAAANAEPAEA